MAKQRTDTESVLKLVVNGEQAKTSAKELADAYRKVTRELVNMKKADDPKAYAEKAAQVGKLKTSLDAAKKEMAGVTAESKKFQTAWKDIAAGIAGGISIASVIQSATGAVKDFVAGSKLAFREAELGQAQMAAALKSTEGVSGKTKDGLNALAESLMKLTGIDDDVITRSENLLLTFTNIRNEIYDDTVPAILDMTAAMNNGNVSMETIQATTIQVGKALNDPIKGITALRKVGVAFSESQKEVISDMVKTNDIAGAQRIILDELKKEFGGVAQAMANTEAGAAQKFQTRIGNIQENVGRLYTGMSNLLAKGLDPFLRWVERLTSTKLSEKLEEERMELNKLEIQITSVNTSQSTRISLIEKLKTQYPDLLGNLNAETATNVEVSRAIKLVNDQLVNKILLQKKDEEIDELNQDRAELLNRKLEYEEKIREKLAKLRDKGYKVNTNGTDPAEELARIMKVYKESQKNAGKSSGGIFDPFFGVGTLLNNYSAVKEFDKNTKAFTDKLIDKKNALAKELGIDLDTKTPDPEVVTPFTVGGTGKESGDKSKKETDYLDNLIDKMSDSYERALSDRKEKLVQEEDAIKAKYEVERREATENLENNKKLSVALLSIKKAEEAELETLRITREVEESELIEKLREEAEADFVEFMNDKADAQEELYQALLTDQQREQLAVDQHYEKLIELADNFGLDTTEIYKKWTEAKLAAFAEGSEKEVKKALEAEVQKKEAMIDTAKEVASALFEIMSNGQRSRSDARISDLERQRDAELANQELTKSQEDAINKKFNDKIKAEKVKAWKAEQRAAIAQALINGALAMTKVSAQTGVLSIAFSPIVAAATAAQIAVIAAQKAPQFKKGGVPDGPSHEEGGIKLVNGITGAIIGEMEGGERILSKDDTSRLDELIYGGQRSRSSGMSINTSGISDAENTLRYGMRREFSGNASNSTNSSSSTNVVVDLTPLEEKMDKFIDAAENAWNYRLLEKKKTQIEKISSDLNA